jgi:16S rRNA processing protein RimM
MRGDPRLEIGGIARAHGIRGEVIVHTHDPESDVLGDVTEIWVDGVERKILEARGTPHRGWIVLLEGVETRNDAELLKGKVVEIDRDALQLSEEDVLLDDLIGCKVVLTDGREWGTIAAIELGSAQDLLVIHDGAIERMLPLVDQFVTNIDVAAGVVTIDPPEGIPENKVTPR